MSNAFNVNALRNVHTKTFGADSISSFDKAIEHATTLLANSSRGMRGNVSHLGVIRRFFAPKTLSFYRTNMSLVFDVPEADINDLTVYYYITTVVAKTAFDEADCLKIGYIVADGTLYFNYITTDAVLNENWLGVF